MPVPLTNFTRTHIRNEVIGTGGSVPTTNVIFAMLVDAATWERFDPAYLDGATSKAQITKAGQFRNYPRPIYGNTAISHDYTKNDCGDGGSGGTVTYTIPANTYYSYVSQADANSQANAANIAGGQAYANSNGGCTWYNDTHSADFQKTDCGSGCTGSYVTYTVTAGTFSSTISKTDANNKAVNAANSSGPGHANTHGSCSCTFYSAARSQRFYKSCADGGSGSSFDYELPYGTFTSTISQADADAKATNDINTNGQNAANSAGVCTWCPDNRGHWIQRNNCPSGQTGNWHEVYYPRGLCELSSTSSKAAAEGNLNGWFSSSEAQNIANANAGCTNNCTEWSNSGSTYCSGNNLVQDQTRVCSGNTESRTIVIESNSSSCMPVPTPNITIIPNSCRMGSSPRGANGAVQISNYTDFSNIEIVIFVGDFPFNSGCGIVWTSNTASAYSTGYGNVSQSALNNIYSSGTCDAIYIQVSCFSITHQTWTTPYISLLCAQD